MYPENTVLLPSSPVWLCLPQFSNHPSWRGGTGAASSLSPHKLPDLFSKIPGLKSHVITLYRFLLLSSVLAYQSLSHLP